MPVDELGDILERLLREANFKSIRLVATTEQYIADGGRTKSSPDGMWERTYIETSTGRRYYEELLRSRNETAVDYRTRAYFDGRKSGGATYSQKDLATITGAGATKEFMNEVSEGQYMAPEPLRYSRVGLVRLAEALPLAERLAPGEVLSRSCERFLFRNVPHGRHPRLSQVYWLDRSTSMPLKVAGYWDDAQLREERPLWVWESLSFDTVGQHHIPRKSRYTQYTLVDSSKGPQATAEVHFVDANEVKSVEYDAAYPASTFWPSAEVAAYEKGLREAPRKPLPVTQVANPVRASAASEEWPVWPGLVLSCALLATAGILWVRGQWR